MNCIMFDCEKHYEEVCSWWNFYAWPPVPKEGLSSFGMLMEHKGQNLCAGWLYITNSDFFLVEWLVTNPNAPLKVRVQGLEYLVDRLVHEATLVGKHLGFSSVKSKGLVKMLKKHGFIIGDEKMTNMIGHF